MANAPWITIVGLGEDGPEGLAPASQKALAEAEVVMGAKRHLSLLPDLAAEAIEWPVPFADGLELLRAQAGRSVVVLASGDPFWFGAGAVIAREFAPQDWRAYPGLSTFSLAASRLGWPLETTICLGLHAAPLQRLRPHLAPGARCLVLLRDGDAVQELATFLDSIGFGDSGLHVMEALGGPRERCTDVRAADVTGSFQHPVCVGITIAGRGVALPQTSGLSDTNFESDGVMTKRPIRALTLSALAPRAGELLWDIGAGSGSVAIEWLQAHPACAAIAIETRGDRVSLIAENAMKLGVDRLEIVHGTAPDALSDLPKPNAVFVGGGLTADMFAALEKLVPQGTRIVANAVTLETEAVLLDLHARCGGALLRIDIAQAGALGKMTGWRAGYPLVQWSGTL